MRLRLLWGAALALLPVLPRAQPAGAGSFSEVSLDVGGGAQPAAPYEGLWAAGPHVALRAATPFYGGRLHLGLRGFSSEGDAERPDFLAVHARVGWGGGVALPGGLRAEGGAHLGGVLYHFEASGPFGAVLQNESELAAGLYARLDAPLAGRLRAWAGADAVQVFTAAPERRLFVEGGLSVTLPLPAAVRRALR